MTTIDKIYFLIDKNNISAASLTKEAELTRGLLSQWKKGLSNPSTEAIKKIALYFGVSTDYLLGLTDIPQQLYNSDEYKKSEADIFFEQFKEMFLKLNENQMSQVVGYMRGMLEANGIVTPYIEIPEKL